MSHLGTLMVAMSITNKIRSWLWVCVLMNRKVQGQQTFLGDSGHETDSEVSP